MSRLLFILCTLFVATSAQPLYYFGQRVDNLQPANPYIRNAYSSYPANMPLNVMPVSQVVWHHGPFSPYGTEGVLGGRQGYYTGNTFISHPYQMYSKLAPTDYDFGSYSATSAPRFNRFDYNYPSTKQLVNVLTGRTFSYSNQPTLPSISSLPPYQRSRSAKGVPNIVISGNTRII